MKIKRILSLAAVGAMLMGNAAFANVPGNSVVLGDKAYDIQLLFDNSYLAEIQAAANEAGGALYYNLGGEWTNIFTGAEVTDFSQWPLITFTEETGQTTQYESGNGEAIIKYTVTVAVDVSEAIPSFKMITLSETTFPDATRFQINDTLGNVGDDIVISTGDNYVTVEMLDLEDNIVATGTLYVAEDGSYELELTPAE